MATAARILWAHCADEQLVEWDADRCFALFTLHTTGAPTPDQRNEFARQIQQLVALYFGRLKTIEKLRAVGLDPRHVAQDIAAFIVTRVRRFNLRVACPKTMIKSFNTAIHHKLADAFNAARPAIAIELTGDIFFSPPTLPDMTELGYQLRRKSTILRVIHGVPGHVGLIINLVRHQRERILHGMGPAPWTALPTPLQAVSDEQRACVTARLMDFTQRWVINRAAVQQ